MEYIRVSPFFDEHPDVEAAGWGAAQLFQFLLRLSGKMDQRGKVRACQLEPSWIARRWNLSPEDIGGQDVLLFIGRGLKKLLEVRLVTIERDTGDVLIPGWERYYKPRAQTPAERKRKQRANGPKVANQAAVSRTVVTERDVTTLHSTKEESKRDTETGTLPLGPLSLVPSAEPAEALAALWDEKADPALSRWVSMPKKRRDVAARALKARPLKGDFSWEVVFWAVGQAPFLLGQNNRGWRANLDWVLRPGIAEKILERDYEGLETKRVAW